MFDFAWSEIALIGVVALVAIGPKDMPVAIKTVTDLIKKARRMASEFQGQVDEMVRDTELQGVRSSLTELRSDLKGLNLRGQLAKAIDADGSLRRAVGDPLDAPPAFPPAHHVDMRPEPTAGDTSAMTSAAAPSAAPAFVPPDPRRAAPAPAAPVAPPAPAFIPPGQGGARAPSLDQGDGANSASDQGTRLPGQGDSRGSVPGAVPRAG